MPPPIWQTRTRNYNLTGRIRLKPHTFETWTRQERVIALEVEETYESATYSAPLPSDDGYNYKIKTRWRNANAIDLCAPSLRWLIDLAPKPQEVRPTSSAVKPGQSPAITIS